MNSRVKPQLPLIYQGYSPNLEKKIVKTCIKIIQKIIILSGFDTLQNGLIKFIIIAIINIKNGRPLKDKKFILKR